MYGVASTERLELTDNTYVEFKNNEQIVIYLNLLSDGKIKEITDMNLHTLLVTSGDSSSNQEEQKLSDNNGNGDGNSSSGQASNGTLSPFSWNQGSTEDVPIFSDMDD